MNILFCTDGSDTSYHALKKALNFLEKDSLIDIFYVIDWGFFPTYVTFPTEEDLYTSSREVAQIIIGKTEEIIFNNGFTTNKKEYINGNPASQILEKISNENYDLVIMGSHGKRGIANWLGSVSRKVVSHSSIPVFIAREPQDKKSETAKDKYEIVFASDGSSFSYNAIQKTAKIFDLSKFDINILTVSPGVETLPVEITMDKAWLELCIEKQKEITNEILLKAVNIFKDININVTNEIILEGNVAEEIIKYLEKSSCNLIVMGSHGREGISEFLLGSVSKRVLSNVYIPVLIVPLVK
ncbi:MAG: universal stress protein [Candidatus Gastranaerophilaceae bacterium]|jgi:nucleotide-binding universal stress UspA family protein